jgi:chemotaxis protein CheD
MNQVIGVAEMRVSDSPEETLITYSLGSCLGITMHDPAAGVGGLLHCMLPHSKLDTVKAERNPAMFVDSGVLVLLQALFDRGAQRKRISVRVAGGAQILDDGKTFNIGERNYTMLRKVLWKNNLLIAGEEVGGSVPRTIALDMATGETRLRVQGQERML